MLTNPERLAAVGPRSGQHGFPLWYKDASGTRLGLAVDPADPFCPAVGELPFPGQPMSFPDNFPDESFYTLVEAAMTTGGAGEPGRARLVLALEAAFGGTGEVADGQQTVFGRVRVRIDGAVPGASYTFTHPYGITEPLEADEDGRVFVTEDIGIVPLAFDGALDSNVAPFLRWTSGAALGPGEFDPPAGHLGDGVTEHTITGSPFTPALNFFRIDGPNIADAGGPRDPDDPTNINRIQTDRFTVQGHLATVAGVDVPRAVYLRTAGGDVTLDVFATSEEGQDIEVGSPGIGSTRMQGTQGRYFARADAGTTVPATVDVTNTTDVPPTVTPSAVTDAVTVSRVDYDAQARTLTVEAASSDEATPPTLEAIDFGPLSAAQTVFSGIDAPPIEIGVVSSAGGTASGTVRGIGPAMAVIPVSASAGPDQTVQQGQTVTLDGSASSGGVTAFGWSQASGPAVSLASPAAAQVTFPAPAAVTDLSFTLTVDGPGGPASDEVVVHVAPLASPVANAGPDDSAAVGETVVLDGSGSVATAAFAWEQIGGTAVNTLADATTARPSFTMPVGTAPLEFRLTATGPGGPDSTATVTITPEVDVIAVDRAEFRTSKVQWRIEGTATGVLPNLVEVRMGGELIGNSQVDTTQSWDVRRTLLPSESALRPAPGAVVTVSSSRDGSASQPVNVRN